MDPIAIQAAPVFTRPKLTILLAALAFALPSTGSAQPQKPVTDSAAREAALRAFEEQLPPFRRAAPDEVLDLLRRRATILLTPLPGFDPGSRMVDLMVERPWTSLRRRCLATTGGPPLPAETAFALVDDMLREGQIADQATPEDKGAIAAMLAALDGRVCRCADHPSLALAADCAS
jgi:hypothetical protein